MTRRGWRRIVLGAAAGAALLGLIAVAGGYNVGVTAGHLPGVPTLFRWTLQNSVRVRADAPSTEPVARAPVSGAGHYDLVCRECHGAPGERVPASMRRTLPPPPHILDALRAWDAGELFWIVKHGIKMTAMPAWPAAERDDEVWEMVRFLQRMPTLDARGYRQAVAGAEATRAPRAGADGPLERCATCHGRDGIGPEGSTVPVIAGLNEDYIVSALEAYRDGRRASGFMAVQASQLTDADIGELAGHYASQPSPLGRQPEPAEAEQPTRGARLAETGLPAERVPACAACHGPKEGPSAPAYPALAGQREAYLATQLDLFRRGVRGGSEFAPLMAFAARNLSDDDIAALAAYYGSKD